MGKKKGHTIVILLIFVFLISSLLSIIIFYNINLNEKTVKVSDQINHERNIEMKAYEFYLSNWEVNTNFKFEDNLIVYKENENYSYFIYEENGAINIRRIKND
jgi:hypothetical protein